MIKLFTRMSFYAVARGRQPGIFRTWAECESQVKGFSGAVYKKFKTNDEAQNFIAIKSSSVAQSKRNFASTSRDNEPPAKRTKEMSEEDMVKFILSCDFDEESGTIKAVPESKSDSNNVNWKPDRIRMIPPDQTTVKIYNGIEFHEDSEGYVHVYTDGSCENNGKKVAVAGLGVFFGKNHPLNAAEPVKGRPTNNSGEIQAAIKAISEAQKHGIKKLNVFTDSQFLINSICKWMSAWKAKGWKLSTGKPVVNQIDFKRLDEIIDNGSTIIKWSYIAAHKGHAGNEAADRLAKEGAQKYRK